MKILIVSATQKEILPLLDRLTVIMDKSFLSNLILDNIHLDILITGVGLPNTIMSLTQTLSKNNDYHLCLNLGICGAFERQLGLGTVVSVKNDRFGDLGVEQADGTFMDIFDVGLADNHHAYNEDGTVKFPKGLDLEHSLPLVNSVTVNKVTGSEKSIAAIYKKYQPDIETMEGAGVFLVCNEYAVPSIQIRAVSNYVEPRNKANWDIPKAISNLSQEVWQLLMELNLKN